MPQVHKFNIHLTAFVEGKAKLTCELKSDGSSRTKLSLHYGLSRQGATVQLVRTWRYTVNNLFRSNLPYENFSHNCQCEIQLNSILKLEETHCSVNPNCNCAVSTSSGQIPIFFSCFEFIKQNMETGDLKRSKSSAQNHVILQLRVL